MSTRREKRDQSLQTFLFCLETSIVLISLDQKYQWTGDTDAATGWLLGSTAQHTSSNCILQNLTAPPLFPSNFADSIFPKLRSNHPMSGSKNKRCLLCYGNLAHNKRVIGQSGSVLIHCWRPENHCIYYWAVPPKQVLGLKSTIQQLWHSKNVDLAINPRKNIIFPSHIFAFFYLYLLLMSIINTIRSIRGRRWSLSEGKGRDVARWLKDNKFASLIK